MQALVAGMGTYGWGHEGATVGKYGNPDGHVETFVDHQPAAKHPRHDPVVVPDLSRACRSGQRSLWCARWCGHELADQSQEA